MATGVSDNLQEAIERCIEYANMVGFKDVLCATEDDLVSTSYPQAIIRRLKYAVENKLIKDDGISEQIKELLGQELKEAEKEIKSKYDNDLKKIKTIIKNNQKRIRF